MSALFLSGYALISCSDLPPSPMQQQNRAFFLANLKKQFIKIAEHCDLKSNCYYDDGHDHIESKACRENMLKTNGFNSLQECDKTAIKVLEQVAEELDISPDEKKKRRRTSRRFSRRGGGSSGGGGGSGGNGGGGTGLCSGDFNIKTGSISGACQSTPPSDSELKTLAVSGLSSSGRRDNQFFSLSHFKKENLGSTSPNQDMISHIEAFGDKIYIYVRQDSVDWDESEVHYVYFDDTRYGASVSSGRTGQTELRDGTAALEVRLTGDLDALNALNALIDKFLSDSVEDEPLWLAKSLSGGSGCRFYTPSGARDVGSACPVSGTDPDSQYKVADFTLKYGHYYHPDHFSRRGFSFAFRSEPADTNQELFLYSFFLNSSSSNKKFVVLNGDLIDFSESDDYYIYAGADRASAQRYALTYLHKHCPSSNNIPHVWFEVESATSYDLAGSADIWIAKEDSENSQCVFYLIEEE